MAEAVLAYVESGNLTASNGDTLIASSSDPLEFESSPVILVADDTGDLWHLKMPSFNKQVIFAHIADS